MARLSRNQILYDGCYSHVISRSIRKMEIFRDEEDFKDFLDALLRAKRESGFKIYHYCLMHTHFHLAVEIPDVQDFSRAVQKLKSQYICRFHSKYKISGPVWRERYQSLLIEDERYLYACGQYIEDNPVKAGMVSVSRNWKYSSSAYYSSGCKDEIVDGYGVNNNPAIPSDVDMEDATFFENGVGIGSGYFRLQLNKSTKLERQDLNVE